MCVLGIETFPSVKDASIPGRLRMVQGSFQSQAVLEWSLCWESLWGWRPSMKAFV